MNILLSTILRGFYLILYIQYGSSRCWFWKWEKCLSFVSTRIYLKTRYYKYIAQAVLKITISLRDWKPKTWNVVGISVTEDQFLKPKKKKIIHCHCPIVLSRWTNESQTHARWYFVLFQGISPRWPEHSSIMAFIRNVDGSFIFLSMHDTVEA